MSLFLNLKWEESLKVEKNGHIQIIVKIAKITTTEIKKNIMSFLYLCVTLKLIVDETKGKEAKESSFILVVMNMMI